MTKAKGRKRKAVSVETEDTVVENELPASSRRSDEPVPKKVKWINKQRVLVFASRGISFRDRHLMEDLRKLMPHSKPESKMEKKGSLFEVNEICEMKNCNKCILFEGRKQKDLYMWMANVTKGPSAKFLVENIHTMGELKLTGNCLKGSRPLLSFDENFESKPHYSLLKEIFTQVFSTPNHHPRSQPFVDHVFTFTILDNRIWFRNYQIMEEVGALAEIGPRFVLNPIKIFDGGFGGQTLWENPFYTSPAKYRQQLSKKAANKYVIRLEQKLAYQQNMPKESYVFNPMDEIFRGDPLEKAKEFESGSEIDSSKERKLPSPEKKKKKKKRNKKNIVR